MPAIITHHIFGEDVLRALPAGMVEGEEEVLAFLLGNQGPDPLFARFSTAPSVAVRCRRLGHAMHDGRVVEAAFAMRDGVSHLPVADERVGRAFALGALGHYALDRTAHPFVFAQQEALAAAEPSLAGAGSELHAVIESDIDSWILWEKRRATVLDRPAADNLMRTERIDRVAGALLSQVAYAAFGVELAAEEYKTPVKIRACDTLGYGVTYPGSALPRSVPGIIYGLNYYAGVPSEWLEWHGHNDFYKAVVNATTAWLYGCSGVNCSLLGIGERTGNCPTEAMCI